MEKCFEPIYSENSRALILGTWPSPKSFDVGFYYGHPQNRFWRLIAALTNSDIPTTIEQKRTIILANNLALWDTIKSCTIIGASDSSIRDVVPNDIAGLLKRSNIEAVFCNGAKAYDVYMKYQFDITGVSAVKLPSTSPANAAYSLDRLYKSWLPLKEYIDS